MKKMFLSSLAVLVTVSAASAATELTPYAAVNLGYERATYNDIVAKYVGGEDHMGNIMGNGYTFGMAGGAEYRATNWLGLRVEAEYMYAHDNNLKWKTWSDSDNENYDDEIATLAEGDDEEEPTAPGTGDEGEGEDEGNTPAAGDDEGEFADTSVRVKKPFDTNTHALFLNVYADFHNSTAFTPYVSAGLGYSWANLKEDTKLDPMKIKDNGLAWQVGAGVSYAATDVLSLDLGYRFVKLANMEKNFIEDDGSSTKVEVTPMMHQIRLGARYAF